MLLLYLLVEKPFVIDMFYWNLSQKLCFQADETVQQVKAHLLSKLKIKLLLLFDPYELHGGKRELAPASHFPTSVYLPIDTYINQCDF